MAAEKKEPYGLDPAFERAALVLCCQNPGFWSRVGHALDPERMQDPRASLVLHAVRAISAESGRGPRQPVVVIQRIRRLVEEGKVAAKAVADVNSMIDDATDAGLPAEDYAVRELVPVVRRKIQSEAVLKAHDEFARRGDFQAVADMLEKAKRLGEEQRVGRVQLGADGFASIERLQSTGRLPTGIMELDLHLGGGYVNATLTVIVADSGGGKSIYLVSGAAEAVRHQLHVGFVTLELPEAVQFARLVANLTGVEWLDVMEIDQKRDLARHRLEEMVPHIGPCHVAEFAPHSTTVQDLIQWVDEREQEVGRKMNVLVVDYGDKLHEPKVQAGNEYLAMRYVYEGLRRDIAVARDMRVLTAAAGQGRDKNLKRRLDMRDVSDSMHKVRVADLVVTLNGHEMMEFFIAKYRLGTSRVVVGPLATDFARGRIVPLVREWREGW